MGVWRNLLDLVTTTPRQRRARRWAAGIRAGFDATRVWWDVGPVSPEFASNASMSWSDVAGVAEDPDDGYIPPGITILRRGARTSDFLPLDADGVRALLAEARRRGLVRAASDLIAERVANGGTR
jgi:hypothetical protein